VISALMWAPHRTERPLLADDGIRVPAKSLPAPLIDTGIVDSADDDARAGGNPATAAGLPALRRSGGHGAGPVGATVWRRERC
jgi:hypothetical protein